MFKNKWIHKLIKIKIRNKRKRNKQLIKTKNEKVYN